MHRMEDGVAVRFLEYVYQRDQHSHMHTVFAKNRNLYEIVVPSVVPLYLVAQILMPRVCTWSPWAVTGHFGPALRGRA